MRALFDDRGALDHDDWSALTDGVQVVEQGLVRALFDDPRSP